MKRISSAVLAGLILVVSYGAPARAQERLHKVAQLTVCTFIGVPVDQMEAIVLKDTGGEGTASLFEWAGWRTQGIEKSPNDVRGRTQIWLTGVWQPRQAHLRVYDFIREIPVGIILDPQMELPHRSPDGVATTVLDSRSPSMDGACEIRFDHRLLPALHRIYVVDMDSGWYAWSEVTPQVGMFGGPHKQGSTTLTSDEHGTLVLK